MQIMEYIDLFLGAVINIILYVMVINKIFNCEIIKNKFMALIYLLLTSSFVCFINSFNKDTFKILFTIPFVIIGVKNIFNVSYKNSIIYVIVSTIYMFISELIVGIILLLTPFDYSFIFNNVIGTTIGSLVVVIFTLPLLYFKKMKTKIAYLIENINTKESIILSILIFIAMGAFAYKNISNIDNKINFIMNITIFISFIIIFNMYFEENEKVNELSKNYNNLFKYLEKYENELVEKRKIIHDYKNQLIIINGYIGNKLKLKEYVNELMLEQKSIKENSIIKNIDKLPNGIKGLIYYKFANVENNVIIDMHIKNNLSKFDKVSSKISKDVLKIIGILIDNAIDAISEEKSKYISISFSLHKDIFKVMIINPCTKNLKIENLMNVGFSTKGKNRGYGLALVKDIIKSESCINVNLNLNNNEFISILELKI